MRDPIKLTIKTQWYRIINVLFSTELSSYRSMYHVISWALGSLAHLGWDVAWGDGEHTEPENRQYFKKWPCCALSNWEAYVDRLLCFRLIGAALSFNAFFLLTHLLPTGHQRVWTSNVLLPKIWLFNLYIHGTALIFLEFIIVVFVWLKNHLKDKILQCCVQK